ncbi:MULTISPECIES: TIGR02611 family protein [unclassified Gordonia (in: high G+C Gram-positive bacteria)]|uniref:TIGR02611 family protein n=1 Tax=unclassified Gordonia (in: high G+C Gram-positive bacteria) TaxID=2657482 RepID=UPI001FFF40F2|nr:MULTISPECIES: TIGR02611 family protein [unclassified Gordonia (in: high G+C Gram-positive bacteria)]UQE76515.1 TIGR02611 family protein [Gordonia sp. PP30]
MRLRLKIWHRRQRYIIRQRPVLNQVYRIVVGVVGAVMMAAGLVMIPLPIPGPGWVTLFLGLAVLATEFTWAHRVTSFLRRQLHRASLFSARLMAWTRTAVAHQVEYHSQTMLVHARSAYTRWHPLPAAA